MMNNDLKNRFNILLERIADKYFARNHKKLNSLSEFELFNTGFRKELKLELVRLIQYPENKELAKELAKVLKSKVFFLYTDNLMISPIYENTLKKQHDIDFFIHIPTERGKQQIKAWSDAAKITLNIKD